MRALGIADARPAAGDRPGLPPRPDASRRSTPPAPTSPGSCARSRPWSPRRPRCAPTACRPTPHGLRKLKAHGLLRRPPGQADRPDRGRGARRAPRAGRAPGVQAHRHLRRRVRAPRRPTCIRPTRPARSARRPSASPSPTARRKAIILGGGPNRIGQGIEFDYCCCHAAFALDEIGVESIMVNCNPETVSTDYDTSDRLYFEPLTAEDVLELIAVEQSKGELLGVIVQFGGQTPLKLAQALEDAGVPILGTIARRHRPGRGPRAVPAAAAQARASPSRSTPSPAAPRRPSPARARSAIPVVIRPSYVLGGRAMEIVRDDEQLDRYIRNAVQVSGDSPVLIDQYLSPRHRGGRRRPVRRRDRVRGRGDGAHRGGRRALGRQRLLPAAVLAARPRPSPS